MLLTGVGIVSQIIGFFYRVLLARLVSPEILGLYQLIFPVYSVMLSLSSIGLTTAVSTLSARLVAQGNRKAVYQLRCRALRLFFLLATLPCVLVLLIPDPISVYVLGDARTRLGLMLLAPCLLLTGVENLQKHYFYGTGHVVPPALAELTEQLIRSAAVLLLLRTFLPQSAENTVGLMVCGMILCEIFSACAQTLLFRWHMGPVNALPGSFQPGDFQRQNILAVAFPVGVTALLGNLMGSANSVLIPRLLVLGGAKPSDAMSAFGVMFGMTFPLISLPTAFVGALGLVLAPKVAELAVTGRKSELRRLVRHTVGTSCLLLTPVLALIAVFGREIGTLFYQNPQAGAFALPLALGMFLTCIQTMLSCCLNGLGLPAVAARCALISDAVQLAVTCCTVGNPAWGLGGFALGFAVSSAVGAWLCWRRISREIGLSLPFFRWCAAPGLGSALAASCARLLGSVLAGAGLGNGHVLGSCFLFGLILYAAALLAMGVSLREKRC